jgi:hypothetical protein
MTILKNEPNIVINAFFISLYIIYSKKVVSHFLKQKSICKNKDVLDVVVVEVVVL